MLKRMNRLRYRLLWGLGWAQGSISNGCAYWCHLMNTTEPRTCGGDAGLLWFSLTTHCILLQETAETPSAPQTSAVTTEAVSCIYYSHTSLHQRRIPGSRLLVGAYRLINNVVNDSKPKWRESGETWEIWVKSIQINATNCVVDSAVNMYALN